ncbi:MAG: histidinol-phosphate transaminase [Spirosomataceae bacterium]
MFSIQSLLRPHLQNLVPYSSARDEYTGKEGIFLDANENAYGSVTEQSFNRYPDPYQWAIKEKLAPLKGVKPSQIFLGNGSDEPIDLLIRGFCEPLVDNIIILPPTYGMYEVSATINNVPIQKVPLTPDFQLDEKAILEAVNSQTKLIWICSPNNPSGNIVSQEGILNILKQVNCLVVVDEAYTDFAPEQSLLSRLADFPNLVVLQTFSKAWGLASLRIGMAFANEEIVRILNKIKPPYNINGLTQQVLLEALDHNDKKNEYVNDIIENRAELAEKLASLSIVNHVFPSDANFLLVRFTDAKGVFDYLIDNKIIVRDRSKVKWCDNALRITVGTKGENDALIVYLQKFVPESVATISNLV